MRRKGQFFIIAGIAFSIALYGFVSNLFLSKTASFDKNEELAKLTSVDNLVKMIYKKIHQLNISNPDIIPDLILLEVSIKEYVQLHHLDDYDFNYYFVNGTWNIEIKIKDKDIYIYKKFT